MVETVVPGPDIPPVAPPLPESGPPPPSEEYVLAFASRLRYLLGHWCGEVARTDAAPAARRKLARHIVENLEAMTQQATVWTRVAVPAADRLSQEDLQTLLLSALETAERLEAFQWSLSGG